MSTPPQMTSGASPTSGGMMNRIMGVITLKAPVYREIADDQTATGQAAIIVVIATLVTGFFGGLTHFDPNTLSYTPSITGGILGAIIAVIVGLIGWVVAAWVLAFVAKWFKGKTNTGEMLRVTGYVHIFGIVGALVVLALILPILGCLVGIISLIIAILQLIGYIIGVREAAEFSTGNAIITAIVAAIVEFIIVAVIGGVIAGIAVGATRLAGG